MTEAYKKRLLVLGKELREQLEAEQEESFDLVPGLLSAKINHLCGFIDTLKETKDK